jgi:hypothetical protein
MFIGSGLGGLFLTWTGVMYNYIIDSICYLCSMTFLLILIYYTAKHPCTHSPFKLWPSLILFRFCLVWNLFSFFFLGGFLLQTAIVYSDNTNMDSFHNQTHANFFQENTSVFRKIIDGFRYIFSDNYITALVFLKSSTVVALGPIDVVRNCAIHVFVINVTLCQLYICFSLYLIFFLWFCLNGFNEMILIFRFDLVWFDLVSVQFD